MFSCEYCEIFNNTYFEEHQRTAASKLFWVSYTIKNKLKKYNLPGFIKPAFLDIGFGLFSNLL